MKMKQLLFILLTTFLARTLFAEQVGNDAYLENDVAGMNKSAAVSKSRTPPV